MPKYILDITKKQLRTALDMVENDYSELLEDAVNEGLSEKESGLPEVRALVKAIKLALKGGS